MADIICRWRNASIKQALEFSSIFPGKTVSKGDGRTIVNTRWETIGGIVFLLHHTNLRPKWECIMKIMV